MNVVRGSKSGGGDADDREALADREGGHLLDPDQAGNAVEQPPDPEDPARQRAAAGRRARRRLRCPPSSSAASLGSAARAALNSSAPSLRLERAAGLHPAACERLVGRLRDRRLRRLGDGLAVGRPEGEVERVAERSAASASPPRGPRPPSCSRRSRARRRPRIPWCGRRPSRGRRRTSRTARVARELAVDAVGDEREVEQHRARDVARLLAGRERGRGGEADAERDHRDLIRRDPSPRGPARHVARPGADEEGREEPVGALDRRLQPDLLLVVLLDLDRRLLDGRARERARPEEPAQREVRRCARRGE